MALQMHETKGNAETPLDILTFDKRAWELMEMSQWHLLTVLAPYVEGLPENEIIGLLKLKVQSGADPEMVYYIGHNGRFRENLEKLVLIGFLDLLPGPLGYPDEDRFRVSERGKALLQKRREESVGTYK